MGPQCKEKKKILNGSTPDSASSSDPIAEPAFMHQIHVVQIRSRNKSAKHEMVWCRRELKAPPGTDRDNRSSIVPFFFFQAEDGIRYLTVTGVQTCALPI